MKIEKGWTVELNGMRYIVAKGGGNIIKLLLNDQVSIRQVPINSKVDNVKVISRNKVGILGKY